MWLVNQRLGFDRFGTLPSPPQEVQTLTFFCPTMDVMESELAEARWELVALATNGIL